MVLFPLRADAGNIQTHPVQTASGAQIQGLAILIAPGKIVRMLGRDDRAQVFALGG